MTSQDPIIYTNATINKSEKIPDMVHIHAEDLVDEILIILTLQEFTDQLKLWLHSLPTEYRQMAMDALQVQGEEVSDG